MKTKKRIFKFYFIIMLSLILIGSSQLMFAQHSSAQSAKEFYDGKTIELAFSGGLGGGYHFWARLVAKYMKKYTGANVIVASKNAAGGAEAVFHVYNANNSEGLLLALARGPSMVVTEVLDFPNFKVKWDSAKFNYIGRITYDVNCFHVNPKKFKNMNDIRSAPTLLFGTDAPFGSVNFHVIMFVEGLGLDQVKIVPGYQGGRARVLAIAQGEIDGCTASYDSYVENYRQGTLLPLAILAKERMKKAPDLPTIWEVGVQKGKERWIEWSAAVDAVGRLIIAPPDVPRDRVKFLQDAFRKVMHDPKFLAAVKKVDKSAEFLSASETKKLIKFASSLTAEEKKELKYMLQKKWMK
ncbi:Bug family tripartite tricarboxylate transporter substrate binding protein [Thermodesulfobacteriota bacterium]